MTATVTLTLTPMVRRPASLCKPGFKTHFPSENWFPRKVKHKDSSREVLSPRRLGARPPAKRSVFSVLFSPHVAPDYILETGKWGAEQVATPRSGSHSGDPDPSGVTPDGWCLVIRGASWQRTEAGSGRETCGGKASRTRLRQPREPLSCVLLILSGHRCAIFQKAHRRGPPSGRQLIYGRPSPRGVVPHRKPPFCALSWLVVDRGCHLWGHITWKCLFLWCHLGFLAPVVTFLPHCWKSELLFFF